MKVFNERVGYGVGDSVGFGVELENRYKGIRTPHKMKFGVSGCTRECAEAQGKDVGIIATEKGWNLFGYSINTLTLFAMVLAIGL
ncbi:hypothetical protein FK514_29300, partial [Klebsiella pneumoniae]|nr:hypothetical protein [Klebsiella pneumoniae]